NEPVIAFATNIQGTLAALLQPHLPLDPGPLAITSEVEGRLENDVLHLAKSTGTIRHQNGALLSASELLQPLVMNLDRSTLAAAQPDAPAARVELGEVPLAWAEAFVAD